MTRTLLLAALLAAARPAAAQEACDQGRISHVFVDSRSIFDLDELGNPPFSWAYRLANRLHVKTRERFLRRELLFEVGGCYEPFLLQDSERLLHLFPFISRAEVFGIRQPDGDWHVVVDTQDEWTTKLSVGVELDRTFEVRSVDLTEQNFLGRGMVIGAFYRETDAERLLGGRISTPRLFNTRLDASLMGGRTRLGSFLHEELFYPFVGEVGRFAARQSYRRLEDYFTYVAGTTPVPVHLLLPLDEEGLEITVAGRVGRPGNLTVFGLGISRDRVVFPGFPGSVERVEDNDFSAAEPASSLEAEALRPQTLYDVGTRLNVLFGQRNITFARRQGLDALRGIQDVEVGTEMSLTLGRTMGFLASQNRPDDLYTRLRLYAAAAPAPFVLVGSLGIEGRQIFSGAGDREGWRDVLGELDVLFYWQSVPWPRHTFFGRLAGAGGWSVDQPFQLTLGGTTGVRGYHDERFPGGERLVFTAEDRIYLGWPFPDLFDLGATVFADIGRIWAGDVPFGADSGWRATVGGGLRIGFPAGSRSVVRVDLALPLGASVSLSDTVVRVSFGDLLGLSGGLSDPQLDRSRRMTVGPDRFHPSR
jgi:hypothetical protein